MFSAAVATSLLHDAFRGTTREYRRWCWRTLPGMLLAAVGELYLETLVFCRR